MTEQLGTTSKPVPETLYRGVVLPAASVTPELITQDLLPGSKPKIDEQGRKTVRDGNEYGVYMSDNPTMVRDAYASPSDYGDDLPNSPSFTWKRPSTRVQAPKVGVTYQIDPTGLELREPFITSQLQGVYNNGFGGNEWITDKVPASNHRITGLKVGRDILHDPKVIEVGDDPEEAFKELRKELDYRMGRLAVICDRLNEMRPENLSNQFAVEKRIQAEIPQ